MKPTHKITIGNEVFLAVHLSTGVYKIGHSLFSRFELEVFNAKIEEITPPPPTPFKFEADVEWVDHDGTGFAALHVENPELIGKRGKLIFQEEV